MRLRRRASAGSLDSLLDTMTNVVGILVIVVAVTQINVAEAIKPGRDGTNVSPKVLKAARQEYERLKALVERARKRWGPLEADAKKNPITLADYRKRIAALKALLNDPAALAADLRKVKAEVSRAELERQRLEREVATAQAERDRLKALADRPPQPTPPAKVVTLPDPQDVPSGAERVTFVCRAGRVFPFHTDKLNKMIAAVIRRETGQRGKTVQLGLSDLPKISSYFRRHDVGDRWFRIRVTHTTFPPNLIVRFEPRKPDQGETVQQMRAPASSFRQSIGRLNPRRHWVKFMVYGDSFETYLAARRIVQPDTRSRSGRRLPVGWTAFALDEKFQGSLIDDGPGPGPDGPD